MEADVSSCGLMGTERWQGSKSISGADCCVRESWNGRISETYTECALIDFGGA